MQPLRRKCLRLYSPRRSGTNTPLVAPWLCTQIINCWRASRKSPWTELPKAYRECLCEPWPMTSKRVTEMAEMYLAGTLSRAHLSRPSDCWQEEFETINALSFLVMPEEKIHEIRRYTGKDNSLQQLKRITQEGWPSDQSSLPPSSLLISASGTSLQLLMVRYSVESEVWSLKECEQLSRRISIADIKELKPACATRGNMFFGQAWTRNKKHGFAPVRHAERIN